MQAVKIVLPVYFLAKFDKKNQKPRSISLYKKANWDGMKQALEAYHQDSGKYSSLNAVQLWDDLHSTLTSLTNKFINSKLSSTRNNLPSVNQKLKSPNFLNNPTLRIFLMWPQNWVKWSSLQTQYKQFLHFSNIPNKILPLLHLYTNTILSTRTTTRKPLMQTDPC